MLRRVTKRRTMEEQNERKGDRPKARPGKEVILSGHPMAFLVTGDDTKHTSMFDWTIPPRAFPLAFTCIAFKQEEAFYVLEGESEWQVDDRWVPGDSRHVPIHSARSTSQHRQCHRQAGEGSHDRVAARP
jgi:hypothetical protein